jgi:hypothetical protein
MRTSDSDQCGKHEALQKRHLAAVRDTPDWSSLIALGKSLARQFDSLANAIAPWIEPTNFASSHPSLSTLPFAFGPPAAAKEWIWSTADVAPQ